MLETVGDDEDVQEEEVESELVVAEMEVGEEALDQGIDKDEVHVDIEDDEVSDLKIPKVVVVVRKIFQSDLGFDWL